MALWKLLLLFQVKRSLEVCGVDNAGQPGKGRSNYLRERSSNFFS